MVELRKRKAPAEPVRAQDTKKTKLPTKASKAKPVAPTKKNIDTKDAPSQPHILKIDDTISLNGFGGEFETHEGVKTTLKALVDGSKSGVVLFTYPKASTPGCKCSYHLFTFGHFNCQHCT